MLKTLGLTLTLIARANLSDGYQLPQATFIDNVSPTINDKGAVAFKLLSFEDGQSGIVIVPKGENSELVYASSPELYLTDPSLNSKNEIYFSEFSEVGPTGLFHYDDQKQLHKLFSANDLFDFSTIGTPASNKEGHCVRLTKGNGLRAVHEVHCFKNGELQKAFGEGQVVRRNDKASYLFTPGFDDKGSFAVKLRLGARGEYEDSRPDVVALIEDSKVHVLVEDVDSDPGSEFISFHNSVSLNNQGEVALVGMNKEKKSCLVLASKTRIESRVCEGNEGIEEIETFTMQINDLGSIAFRAINSQGKRKVYLLKKGEIKPLAMIGEGDIVQTDLGEDRIIYKKNYPGLSGNIDLNNKNEIVFHAVLEESGSGIFVISEKP